MFHPGGRNIGTFGPGFPIHQNHSGWLSDLFLVKFIASILLHLELHNSYSYLKLLLETLHLKQPPKYRNSFFTTMETVFLRSCFAICDLQGHVINAIHFLREKKIHNQSWQQQAETQNSKRNSHQYHGTIFYKNEISRHKFLKITT